jgi:hypothetical protein
MEIVGVVRNLGTNASNRDPLHGMESEDRIAFRPASPSEALPLRVAVKTPGPAALASRLRTVAAEVDPGVRLYDLLPLDEVMRQRYHPELLAALSGVGGILLCILLSAAGLFALMAVGVARRTREVGIRLALGASRSGVLGTLFGRAAKQLASGVGLGSALYLGVTAAFDSLTGYVLWPVATVSVVMLLVGLGACAVPARRALRIKPVEALRE